MSVSSILAFVLAGVAAKTSRADRADEKQRELIALRIDNSDLRRELDQAREDYNALRRENAAQAWALSGRPAPGLGQHPLQQHELAQQQNVLHGDTAFAWRQQNAALAQEAMAMQAQANHPQAQQLAQYQNYQAAQLRNQGLAPLGLLGAQNLID